MRNKQIKWFFVLVLVFAVGATGIILSQQKKVSAEIFQEISPKKGSIRTFISCSGTVLPKNRLEIKPPVNGRIESILVQEGDKIKIGQILAWMSSTERAALLDAARGKGEKELQYWQDAYKAIPLPAPIDGEVIVAKTQPGQTVTTADAVVVLSDRLIVRAQVDETDIGKIKLKMKAVISLDAYPDIQINAGVDHIYYESQTVNNVTIYEVDLLPENVPLFFRSGMNATVNFIEQDKENILLLPLSAVRQEKGESEVLVKQENEKEPVSVRVKLGIADDKNVEIISGITENTTVVVQGKKYSLPKNSTGTNPFMPQRRR